jgi:hypothetical protein
MCKSLVPRGLEERFSLFGWLVLVCSERRVLLAGCWWLVCCEGKVLLAGKPSEQSQSLWTPTVKAKKIRN